MRIWGVCAAAVVGLVTSGARAADGPNGEEGRERTHLPGQRGVVELDALAGTVLGLRLKALIHPARTWGIALEGLVGDTLANADGSVLRVARGGGVRADVVLTGSGRSAAMLGPGADVLYLPREAPQSPSLFHVLDYLGRDPGLLLAPNLDFTVLYELSPHACLLFGLRGGAVLALRGHDGSGNAVAGAWRPDAGLFVGARF